MTNFEKEFSEIWRPVMIKEGKKIAPEATDEEAIRIVCNIGLSAARLPLIEDDD